jgi:hypothetical protein
MARQYTGLTGQSYRDDQHVGVMPATPSINTSAWCAEQVSTRLPCDVASLEKIRACSFVCSIVMSSTYDSDFSVHHQESSTVYTAIGICHTCYADCLLAA